MERYPGTRTAHGTAERNAPASASRRRQALGEEVAASIRAAGGEARFLQADVREERQVAAPVRECVRAYGTVDIAFNNARIEGPEGRYGEVPLTGEQSYQDVMRTNVDGDFFAMRHELPGAWITSHTRW